jgi:hypothetical protein
MMAATERRVAVAHLDFSKIWELKAIASVVMQSRGQPVGVNNSLFRKLISVIPYVGNCAKSHSAQQGQDALSKQEAEADTLRPWW